MTSPPAEGKRLPWSDIPALLRAEIEQLLGGRVTEAVTQPGGFSPGVAARIRLDHGGRAFVKAVGDINPESPGIHRAEARIAAALPSGTPHRGCSAPSTPADGSSWCWKTSRAGCPPSRGGGPSWTGCSTP